jgi:hypothetical protein
MTKEEQLIEDKRQSLISDYTDSIQVAVDAEHKAAIAWDKLQGYNKLHPHQTKIY